MLGVTTSDAPMVMGQLLDLGLLVGLSLLRQMAPVSCRLIGSEEVSVQMLNGHRLSPDAEVGFQQTQLVAVGLRGANPTLSKLSHRQKHIIIE